MKTVKFPKERGQVLVIVAFAAVALFAFAALAIDGSAIFSDRRHSQNASDTAVLAAALDKVRGDPLNPTWQTVGLARATDNDYDDADAETEVYIRSCGDANLPVTSDGVQVECKGLPSGADPNQYIVVHIKSVVHLTFARILGWETSTNHTDAVSRATDPVTTNWFDGYAIASLHEGCQSPGESDPFELGGNAEVNITGGGVYVNASCPTADSFVQNGTSSTMLTADGGTCVVGTSDNTSGVTPPPTEGCDPVDVSTYQLPSAPICQNEGTLTEISNGVWLATPGYFDDEFPDPQGGQADIKLSKGVYCLRDGLGTNAGWSMTTDLDGDGHDSSTEGVLFYVSGGDITFNGGADINVHAINQSSASWFQPEWLNLLIFVDPDNEAVINISGNSGSSYTGTILATTSHINLLGNGGTVGLDSKIISDTVNISGSTEFDLSYNDANNATTITNPGIELTE